MDRLDDTERDVGIPQPNPMALPASADNTPMLVHYNQHMKDAEAWIIVARSRAARGAKGMVRDMLVAAVEDYRKAAEMLKLHADKLAKDIGMEDE